MADRQDMGQNKGSAGAHKGTVSRATTSSVKDTAVQGSSVRQSVSIRQPSCVGKSSGIGQPLIIGESSEKCNCAGQKAHKYGTST